MEDSLQPQATAVLCLPGSALSKFCISFCIHGIDDVCQDGTLFRPVDLDLAVRFLHEKVHVM